MDRFKWALPPVKNKLVSKLCIWSKYARKSTVYKWNSRSHYYGRKYGRKEESRPKGKDVLCCCQTQGMTWSDHIIDLHGWRPFNFIIVIPISLVKADLSITSTLLTVAGGRSGVGGSSTFRISTHCLYFNSLIHSLTY